MSARDSFVSLPAIERAQTARDLCLRTPLRAAALHALCPLPAFHSLLMTVCACALQGNILLTS